MRGSFRYIKTQKIFLICWFPRRTILLNELINQIYTKHDLEILLMSYWCRRCFGKKVDSISLWMIRLKGQCTEIFPILHNRICCCRCSQYMRFWRIGNMATRVPAYLTYHEIVVFGFSFILMQASAFHVCQSTIV